MAMKIIRAPEVNEIAQRDQWIADFVNAVPAGVDPPLVTPTGYQDQGASVRFSFASGYVIEWQWRLQSAAIAVAEATVVGAFAR